MKTLCILLVLLINGISSFSQSQILYAKDLPKLASMMTGEFSSEKQAAADKDFLHIRLSMTPIMPGNKDGYWLYVEQAMASAMDKPYRQRVYRLSIADDTTIVSKVFELKNPLAYTGGHEMPEKLAAITPDSLTDRQGCSIYLHKTGKNRYEGSTPGKECLSSLRGATYATSEVVITPKKMVSWDRGWDREDKQVWGSEKGGYVFLKKK
ncbi:MAG: chromophore lyase CpcT/CpeT [Bacteroidales bacterium]|jgi:hypothetical protein|nr:chromophore lyase CpcT/CpeT [Bacteroidales bacterium]